MFFLFLIASREYDFSFYHRNLRSWQLEDSRVLVLHEAQPYCSRNPCPRVLLSPKVYAFIKSGSKQIDFNASSGKIKLADGRTAYVGNDQYLRIVGKDVSTTEVYKLNDNIYR
ncbi:hypothetical protein TVAG_076010 [Trichomonas vaginalis G3]|uniref:Uncharacterized protein n=1 Tax=Trichomonas vaginalis (strain ATCC PRA-98 / G3) TaxID=412133 RepID=A2D9J8_TRIV3|nr:hypothetical protein TVAGG3_0293170 [Trichomonas vaginalis G3]EAY22854.1 hypothetical protein TVAG_076010 [Trichomonas vaginalis G3]KAI5527432.1 hypothetical protein TVAGG3_0293170 [Trichomonas vaginalis G3]|eukprot:XP_001583840.1 hypothetical protein [Trichomonas vaginalis G3]